MWLITFQTDENLPDLAAWEHGWQVESLMVLCEVWLISKVLMSHSVEFWIKKLTNIIANVKVAFYGENISEKLVTFGKNLRAKTRQTNVT